MKMIQETIDGENYLELVMHTAEAKSLLERKIVCLEDRIAGEMYQIGVRTGSIKELEEENMASGKSDNPEIISKNITNMIDRGHPQKVAVAANKPKSRNKKPKQKKGS